MKRSKIFKLLLSLVLISLSFSQNISKDKEYGDPHYFEKSIIAFEKADSIDFPEKGAIVCVGSSSMRGWHGTIHEDLSPLTIIPRGFGGSNMNDALHYADRIILKYKPRAVVIYEGDNDVAQGISPEKILATLKKLIAKIYNSDPKCRIYILSVKPCPSRWHLWPQTLKINKLMHEECTRNELLTYIDIATPMLDKDGEPKPEIFQKDNLHMNRQGYILWRNVVRPILKKEELKFEH